MTASQESASQGPAPARRTVVAAVGAAGIAAVLTACAGSDDGSSEPAGNASSAGGGGSEELARTSDIPEGGGKIFADAGVVVTQPKKGEFKGFTSTCTHQGCAVTKVEDGTIDCPCHGSRFSIEDGSVAHPPATRPLPEKKIVVKGGSISLA
ncbi:Rieske (2Fe-2S) protein [Streptomyces sp. SID14478]|uniref:Rieske (2Fe-2S) protein n=1 Tax=Streptomyces sp. SID14478 TaxID=2706073 RepID=UPI0013DF84B4|nr:Rieske (2Fe-2S) protein [Streptomyces sp. SID14478]NEB81714.1 Rieske (2Fe-2S) protein [Streptomyces sp. SID14478]